MEENQSVCTDSKKLDLGFKFDNNITIAKPVGCGTIYCIFTERGDSFNRLFIKGDMAKSCPCGESWLNSLAALLTFSLRRSIWEGTTNKAIVKHLMFQRCPSAVANKDHIVSCADAIGRCVLEYLKRCDLEGVND